MVLADSPRAEAQQLITQCAEAARHNPGLLTFLEALTRNGAMEDLARFTAHELIALAKLALERAAARAPGASVVALIDPAIEIPDYTRKETALVAVNDDAPFLFDSLMGEVAAQGFAVRAVFHPILSIAGRATSVIVVMLDPILDEDSRQALLQGAEAAFAQVHLAVRDWRAMRDGLASAIAEMKSTPSNAPADQKGEAVAFLEWLADNHFTFLGARDYAYSDDDGGALIPIDGSGLGVLSDREARIVRREPGVTEVSPKLKEFLFEPSPLIVTKSNQRSLVHRRVNMDYIGVKRFDAAGRFLGERRFVGLFTSGAYSLTPRDIPLLRFKAEAVMARAGLPAGGHDAKTLAHIIDTFPRDELFQVSEDELYDTAMGILRLTERPKLKLFLRFDRFDRYAVAIVFVPRERYDGVVHDKLHALLAEAVGGQQMESTPSLTDSVLARIVYTVSLEEGAPELLDIAALEAEMRAAIRTWEDGFLEVLKARFGDMDGHQRFRLSAPGIPARYRDAFLPAEGADDIAALENLARSGRKPPIEARVTRKKADRRSVLHIKLYGLGPALTLSQSLPVFENFGLKVIAEDAYPIVIEDGEAFVLDFLMERADQASADEPELKPLLESAFHAVIAGEAESDGFHRLVIVAGLAWRDIVILRAAAKFLRQAAVPFSQDYMEQALSRNPDIARMLVALFHAHLAPDHASEEAANALYTRIETALHDVQSLDDDRILRRLRNVVANVLRTNFYQRDAGGLPRPYLALKLASAKLDELPAPRPLVEIFVYSPQVEGVHLRFGKVARGGLRWSDRKEDFRTEVLGLVKAQQVKNACIVPVGSKGGFYPKQMPLNPNREETMATGIAAYKTFVNALLDVTDNLHPDGSVAPPKNVVRRDGDDPYLVVAADKGTATFSDIANGIAESRGFWLGDAFASGGSHGYDHKKMGITARGAFEAVKRHFREIGRDILSEPFTAVGIGDMSGDVFGNGALLSKTMKLLAAFDHRHIFIDPTPDAVKAWAERQRLFDLPRSSWADYDSALISHGGGVFARSLKEIALSPEMKALTGLTGVTATPNELIKALLKAEVDLLWLGGIGTYVKASSQAQTEAGDRANDAIRINGKELRAKVVGEGANLGLTQLGRIEYALGGGRINTDAIDNSAGVDTSDHEVNLKILMGGPLRRGELTPADRDALLAVMTDEVARLVLTDNYDQTLALTVAEARGAADLDASGRYMRDLEARGRLDRTVEFLPDDGEIRRRLQAGKGLTRPELAVLLAYAKLDLKAELITSDLPDDLYFLPALSAYFPPEAVQRLPEELGKHRLKREIITDGVANRVVNLAGPLFVARMKEMSGASEARVVRAFAVADGAFGLSQLKRRIDALDRKIDATLQTSMYGDIAQILRRLGLWFITNLPQGAELAEAVALYRSAAELLRGTFSTLISPYEAEDTEGRIAELTQAGVPVDIAEDVATLALMGGLPEIALLAHLRGLDLDLVAGAFFAVGKAAGIDRLRGKASRISAAEHWDRLAIRRIMDDLYAGQRALTAAALSDVTGGTGRQAGAQAVERWRDGHSDALHRTTTFLAALDAAGELSVAKLTLANSQIHELAMR
ncbi:MAG: NAD-glutamate dehydrogenase [Rhizomicrobium sp.]|nr:NAD-glutamate dehydrogenase [Rhizomicrobium sp.]